MSARTLSRLAMMLPMLGATACAGFGPIIGKNAEAMFRTPAAVPDKVREPRRADARLAVLWVGHATVLVQIDDKLILTDPVFTSTVGMLSRRLVEPGLDPEDLPAVDATVISHLHYDHLSLGSLELIERKVGILILPQSGLTVVPGTFAFDSIELRRWKTWEKDGLRITSVPVKHVGFRYGMDMEWMTTGFTGYVIEYHGLTVYFGGDTAYDREAFTRTSERFPHIDLALIPIAPIEPRAWMEKTHVDPTEAVQAFIDLKAKRMIPVHHSTFVNSREAPGEPARVLRRIMAERGLDEDTIQILRIGEQRVIVRR